LSIPYIGDSLRLKGNSVALRFDRSNLPAAQLEFVVVADTHYMVDVGDAPLEFESRRHQGRRAGAAWTAIEGVDPEFVVHMGDMVQEFPGRPEYERTMAEARDQIEAAGLWDRCHFVVGNHDIGDRPDPTMPTGEMTAASLDNWQQRFGPSWHTWDAAGLHFVTLNSQLFNTDLPQTEQQRLWFEQLLASFGSEPCVLFLHMPPYLSHADEPWLGHYDNLGEPDRGWLLSLISRHRVIAMFSGHVHWQFFDHVPAEHGPCRYFVTPSTSFTRPGFSHLFHSAAPSEQGRNDVDKTGFFLCRVVQGRLDVHRLRLSQLPEDDGRAQVLVTQLSAAAPPSCRFEIGVTLRHVLATHTEVPVAWPSVIRQPVRNDYPLLSCTELGARWVRTPIADLLNPEQAARHEILRAEGVGIIAVALGEVEAIKHGASVANGADGLEVQLPGRAMPLTDTLSQLADIGLPLSFCPVLPGQPVAGKQHKRTRLGFLPEELAELGDCLNEREIQASAVCRIDPQAPWESVSAWKEVLTGRPWNLQLLAELSGRDQAINTAAAARAVLAATSLDCPLFLEPLIDMDRTMDVNDGLLDTLCNPRPAFDVVRSLATLLREHSGWALSIEQRQGFECIGLGTRVTVLIPGAQARRLGDVLGRSPAGGARTYRCMASAVCDFDDDFSVGPATGPVAVIGER
jgi:hypothetical protein